MRPPAEGTDVPANPARIGPYTCGAGQPLLVIAGPCVIENEELTHTIAQRLDRAAARIADPADFQGVVR